MVLRRALPSSLTAGLSNPPRHAPLGCAGGKKSDAPVGAVGGGGQGRGKAASPAKDGGAPKKKQKARARDANSPGRALRERTSQPDYRSQIELPNLEALTEEGWAEEAVAEEALLEARERRREAQKKKMKRQKSGKR